MVYQGRKQKSKGETARAKVDRYVQEHPGSVGKDITDGTHLPASTVRSILSVRVKDKIYTRKKKSRLYHYSLRTK